MNYFGKTFWAAAVILFSACQDDEDVSRQTLLIGTWSLDEQSIDKVTVSSGENELEFTEEEFIQFLGISGEDITVDELRLFSETTTFTFDEDGSYRINDTDNLETISGTWQLSDDESRVLLSVASNEFITFDIQSLSGSRMKAGFTYSEIDEGTSVQVDFIFMFTK